VELCDGKGIRILLMNKDENIDFSIAKKDTLLLERVTKVSQPDVSKVLQTLKKTRLERLPLKGTTSAVMQAIRGAHVKHLSEYFEQTCDRRQHETAIIYGSSQLTYQELDQRANRLAHLLIARGVGRGNTVGILLNSSLDTYIALLGVLKAGAAFVPLDSSFPAELVTFIAKDAGLRDIVTTFAFREKTNDLPCPVLELDQVCAALSVQPETRPQIHIDPVSLCYISYKLGTTDQPKGVAVSHINIVNFLRVVTPTYGLTRHDRVYQGMSIAFDFSLQEVWPTWIVGATLVAEPPDAQHLGYELGDFLVEYNVTMLCCVPAQLAAITSEVPSLRLLIVCGETCPAELVNRWSRPGRRMLNTYGPTETTVTATWSEMFLNRPVTIGSPLPTYHTYILDDHFHVVEDGKSGEICIGGPSVAIGYHNRPDLTKKYFIPNPVLRDREIVPRLYRTGDIGRITSAGEIEYLGRIDIHEKIRGYRSELSEIEQRAFPQVAPALLGSTSELAAETSRLRMLKRIDLKNVYKHVMTDPLYRNSLFNMASTFMLGGLGFVFWIIIARLYKAENVGIATTLISIMTLLTSFTLLGLNSSLNRYLPKSANKNELINSSFIIVTLVTLLASVIFLLGLRVFSPQLLFLQSDFLYSVSFAVFVIFCAWNTLVESIFMAFRAASSIFMKNSIISILKLILPFAFIAFGAYGIFASTATALALGVLAGLVVIMLKFKIKPSLAVNVSLVRETSVYSFANYIVGFMFNMPSLVLPVIILNVLSAKYAAYYYIASMIQNILLIIPLATAQALLTEGSYNEAELKKHVKKAIVTILITLVPATTVIVFGGNILLQFFGKSYANEAFNFLQLYSISTIFTALILVANAILNVKHQTKLLVISNLIASVLTLWLSYAFISDKLVGIGWGWTLGQAVAGLVSLFFILKVFFN